LAIPDPQTVRRRGMGAIPQLSEEYCKSGWSLLNPVAWLGGCAARDVAGVYQQVQYGGDPPAPVPPPAPTLRLISGAEAASIPTAVYAGKDADGVAVYAVPSTAVENQAVAVDNQNRQIDQAAAAGWN